MSTIGLNYALGCLQTHRTLDILNDVEFLAECHITIETDTYPYFLESVKPRWKPGSTNDLVATGDRLTIVCAVEVCTLPVGVWVVGLFEAFTISITLLERHLKNEFVLLTNFVFRSP